MISTVSVVVPCYRQAHYLPECVASLQAQSHTDWEAIIVNDGSPDNTSAIAAGLAAADKRVRYVEQPNGGLSAARNAGMAVARGDAFQFLDADDLLQPEKLRHQIAVLNTKPEVGVVYGGGRYFLDGVPDRLSFNLAPGGPEEDWIAARWSAWLSCPPGFVRHNLFPVCAPLVRRTVADKVGLFDHTLPALEDWDYWWRCEQADTQFAYVPDEGTHALIRVHGASMTHESPRMKRAYMLLRQKHLNALPLGPLREHHLDEFLRGAVDVLRTGEPLVLKNLLAGVPAGAEHLQALLYFGLQWPWLGQWPLRAVCRSIPWRVRLWLAGKTGLRALCSV